MNKKEKWAEEILQSLEGIERATPSDDLFAKINQQLVKQDRSNVIPFHQLKWFAAAACLLISINIVAFSTKGNEVETNEQSTLYENQLITDYSLYE